MQTNIANNNNKFYVIQLIESDDGGKYWVWNRYVSPCALAVPLCYVIFDIVLPLVLPQMGPSGSAGPKCVADVWL